MIERFLCEILKFLVLLVQNVQFGGAVFLGVVVVGEKDEFRALVFGKLLA